LLRLDALRPSGFTAYDLADHASVQAETARAFLNPSKGPGYAEAIPGAKAPARPDGGGRPATLYRLRADRRTDLLQRLTELRHGLNLVANVPMPPKNELFAPLELLEATLEELELRPGSPDEWRARLAEARLELRSGEADLRALQAKTSAHAPDFALRLSAVHNRLAAVERAGPPCDASG
jgi:hypothetical protein